MRPTVRLLCAIHLALAFVPAAIAQNGSRWHMNETLQGSFNSAGSVFKLDNEISFSLSDRFELSGGLPLYLVKASSERGPLGDAWNVGIGNAYLGFGTQFQGNSWVFGSRVRGGAPTGDSNRGFGTGEATVDWNNSLAVFLPGMTLFGGAGIANTVSDTSFFVRPFSTSGLVGHVDGGVFVPLTPAVAVGGLAYAVRGSGEQEVVSRLVESDRLGDSRDRPVFERDHVTVGEDLADDHGFSTWLDLLGPGDLNVQLGYSRSVPYSYDTVFFSVGLDVIPLFR